MSGQYAVGIGKWKRKLRMRVQYLLCTSCTSSGRRNQFCVTVILLLLLSVYFTIHPEGSLKKFSEPQQAHNESVDGCVFPTLSPFSEIAMRFDRSYPKVVCDGADWVTCNITECYVRPDILDTMDDVVCIYKDIVYVNDNHYTISEPARVLGDGKYVLNASDDVRVSCYGYDKNGWSWIAKRWYGYKSGIRPIAPPLPAREGSLNVLILAFDSASHHGFVRKMPKSYKIIREELGAVVLEGYNIVGDGTPEALFPILSGKTWMEHNSYAKQRISKEVLLNPDLFLFNIVKENGYETAFYEDMPIIGTFQYRFNGFTSRSADHLLRSMLMDATAYGLTWHNGRQQRYCLGATPQYLFMLDLTRKFMSLPTPRFCFTFVSDISHDDLDLISTADEDLVEFLSSLRKSGMLDNTLLFVMADHGPRFTPLREYYQGKIEERMPFVSVVLPPSLLMKRPDALHHLRANAKVLTTPFDIHTTILDAMGLQKYVIKFKASNARSLRGLSLLEEIPKERNCEDACILPHWCVCLNRKWYAVAKEDDFYQKAADALVHFVNTVTLEKRSVCEERKLINAEWVIRHDTTSSNGTDPTVYFQAMIVMSPRRAVFQGTMRYDPTTDQFSVSDAEVSRISAYGNEPDCVSSTHPHLNKYCFCKSVFSYIHL